MGEVVDDPLLGKEAAAEDVDEAAAEDALEEPAAAAAVVVGVSEVVTTTVIGAKELSPAAVGVRVTTEVMSSVVGAAADAETMEVTTLVVPACTVVVLGLKICDETEEAIAEETEAWADELAAAAEEEKEVWALDDVVLTTVDMVSCLCDEMDG